LDAATLHRLEKALHFVPTDVDSGPDVEKRIVTALLPENGLSLQLPARTKNSVLRELVALADRTELLYDAEGLFESLVAREEACSTALPRGIAIPHPVRPLPYALAQPFICLARVTGGVGFGDPDGKLTYLFFLICCQDHRHHLTVLARLMRMLDLPTLEGLITMEGEAKIRELLRARELAVARGH